MIPARFSWFALVLVGFVLIAWWWVLIVFVLGVVGLQRHVVWVIRHGQQVVHRQERIDATRREMESELTGKVRPIPPTPRVDLPVDG